MSDDSEESVNLVEVLELLELSALLATPTSTPNNQSANFSGTGNATSPLFKGGHSRRRQMEMVVQLTDAEEKLELSVRIIASQRQTIYFKSFQTPTFSLTCSPCQIQIFFF